MTNKHKIQNKLHLLINNVYLILIILLLFNFLEASGGYDNGTANGKGKWQLDLTWNPFDIIENGQTYIVASYGIGNKIDLHSYFSRHKEIFYTYYIGVFYQFYKSDHLDIATAFGFRKNIKESWTHIFFPQVLYTLHLNNKIKFGGSFVNVFEYNSIVNYGFAIDGSISFKLNYKSENIENIYLSLGAFRPVTGDQESNFLPTYSIDIAFK